MALTVIASVCCTESRGFDLPALQTVCSENNGSEELKWQASEEFFSAFLVPARSGFGRPFNQK